MSDQPLSVTVTENGPIRLQGEAISMRYCGEPVTLEDGQDVWLCRCGQSENAPFCDGSHKRVGFTAEDGTSEEKEVKVWEGQTIRTRFNPNACMHVFYCKPLKELRKREEEGDAEAAAEIARVVQTCPSGALTYELKEASVPEPEPIAEGPCLVDVIEGGEVRIRGAYTINAERHTEQGEKRATLCRCGLSRNKPWCDGRHKGRKDFR